MKLVNFRKYGNHYFVSKLKRFQVISASHNGHLAFKVETDEVTATTYFSNMEIENADQNSHDRNEDGDEVTEARIDIQKFVTFLNVQQFTNARVFCGIVHGQAVHMFLKEGGGMLFQYFIPAMNVSIL